MDRRSIMQMQAMLGRLGGGAGGGETQALVQKIQSADDATQMDGLTGLIDFLNMASEMSLMGLRPDQVVPAIMTAFRKQHNPQLMLVAARALTYLIDAMPVAVQALQSGDSLRQLLDGLREIQDTEFADQLLTCVDKIARSAPKVLLVHDGVSAVMGFIDFFDRTTQRLILRTVARIAESFTPAFYKAFDSSLPALRNFLSHEDPRMREEALTAFARLVTRSSSDAACTDRIFGDAGVAVMDILEKRPTEAMFATAMSLTTAAVKCPQVAERLTTLGAVVFFSGLLTGPAPQGDVSMGSFTGSVEPSSPQRVPTGSDPSPGRSSAQSASPGANPKRLSHDRTLEVCQTLVAFAPPVADGSFIEHIAKAHLADAQAKKHHAQRHHAHNEQPASGGHAHGSLHRRLMQLARMGAGADNNDDDDDNPHEEDEHIEDDDDDDGSEYFDMDGDEEMDSDEERECLTSAIAEGLIRVENNLERHKRCHFGRHTCDQCGERLGDPSRWLRCNSRTDFDTCAGCVLQMDEPDTEHTFTLMSAVFTAAGDPFGAEAPTPAQQAAAAQRGQASTPAGSAAARPKTREAILKQSPQLVDRLAEALPAVCRLVLDADADAIRSHGLTFVCRVVHLAPAETLRVVLQDCPLCEVVSSALSSTHLSVLARCLHICRELLAKLPNIYINLFIREGVTNGLAVVKSGVSIDRRAEAGTKALAEVVGSEAGWRALLAFEADKVLNGFSGADDCGRLAAMQELCTKLRNAENSTSALAAAAVILADVSSFELMNSDTIAALRHLLTTSAEGPEHIVARFVSVLAAAPAVGESSLLARCVTLLHSIISQTESFAPPDAGGFDMRHPLRLRIVPHDPDKAAPDAEKGAKGKAKKAEAKKAAKKGAKGSNKGTPRPADPDPAPAVVPKTEGHTAEVSIDPLASVASITDFIRQHLLPGSQRRGQAGGRERQEDDDAVEDIDPDSVDDDTQPKRTRTEGPPAEQTLFLRFERNALPPTMTMVQLMQRYVKKDRNGRGGAPASRAPEGLLGLPPELLRMMLVGETIEVVYSTVPYTAPTVVAPLDAGSKRLSAPTEHAIAFDPVGLRTSGAIAVRDAVGTQFSRSAPFLQPVISGALYLLNVLHAACSHWDSLVQWVAIQGGQTVAATDLNTPFIAHTDFVNSKISSKAIQHATNIAMCGQHDQAWYVRLLLDCPAIFSPAARRFLFDVSFFGNARSLVRIQEAMAENGTLVEDESTRERRQQHRIHRKKCRVRREKPIASAMKVFSSAKANLACVFEFEFLGEPGSGLGPTMEFYSLVGSALCERALGLWRPSDEDTPQHFAATSGLFPSAMAGDAGPAKEAHVASHFRFLGRFLARVMLDRRIPNLRLARPLLKMLRGDELGIDDIADISPNVYEILTAMLTSAHTPQPGHLATLARPCGVEDLGLTFALPGEVEIPLCPGGADTDVAAHNMLDYARTVAAGLLRDTIKVPVAALRDGFASVVSPQALRALTIDELSSMVKGHTDHISLAELEAHVACDHGFTSSSPVIHTFFELLAEMPAEQQQRFFQFLTGSPMLPVGGLAQLKPRFTIVRKTSDDPKVPEQQQLPSAMTCQNYLKLPAYDNKTLMSEKLRLAIEEGANAFHFT